MTERMRPSQVPSELVDLGVKAWRDEPTLQLPRVWMRNVLSEVLTAYNRMGNAVADVPQGSTNESLTRWLEELAEHVSSLERVVIAHVETHDDGLHRAVEGLTNSVARIVMTMDEYGQRIRKLENGGG